MAFAINTLFALVTRLWKAYSHRVIVELNKKATGLHRVFGTNIEEKEIVKLTEGLHKILTAFHNKYDPISKWFRIVGFIFALLCVFVLWTGLLKTIGYYSIVLLVPFPCAIMVIWLIQKRTIKKFDDLCSSLVQERQGEGEENDVADKIRTEVKDILKNIKK